MICEALNIKTEVILDYGKQTDKSYLIIFHPSVIEFLTIPAGNIIIPLILWMNKKDKKIGLKEIGANLLNYQIKWSIITFLSITGFTLYALNKTLPIIFAIKTSKGKTVSLYPNIIKLIK